MLVLTSRLANNVYIDLDLLIHKPVWQEQGTHAPFFEFNHKLRIRDKRHERDFIVSAFKVVLCYNALNYKLLYGMKTDLFELVETIVV